jgi:hypothetical protein
MSGFALMSLVSLGCMVPRTLPDDFGFDGSKPSFGDGVGVT